MTLEEIRSWVQSNVSQKAHEFGVPHWRINVEYAPLDHGDMLNKFLPSYERSTITIDYTKYHERTEKELCEDFEHELMHLALAPYTSLHAVVRDALPKGMEDHIDTLTNEITEMAVRNLERLVYGIRRACKEVA